MRGRSCFANSCRINHFGIKPVSGGRPPSDSNTKAVVVVKIGLFDQTVARVPIFVADEAFKVRNAADVIQIYVSSARRVSCGAY
jgi:hypothetical protein